MLLGSVLGVLEGMAESVGASDGDIVATDGASVGMTLTEGDTEGTELGSSDGEALGGVDIWSPPPQLQHADEEVLPL